MVRNYVRKTNKGLSYSREQLRAAILRIKRGEMGLLMASKIYGVPKSTLQDRVKGGLKSLTGGRPTTIAYEDEKKLADCIRTLELLDFALTRKEVAVIAREFMKENNIKNRFKSKTPGAEWLVAFCKRHNITIMREKKTVKRESEQSAEDSLT